jgi:hypothetical protein
MHKKALLMGLLSLSLSLGVTVNAWANPSITPEKMKAYAEIYPDIFQISMHTVSHTPATGGKTQAVRLLLDSFDGNTDVDELSAALRPSDFSPMKKEQQIRRLLASKNIQWNEYLEITRLLSRDPALFKVFMHHLDPNRVQHQLISQAANDPNFIRNINSDDHQIIMKNLVANFRN